MLFLTKDSSLIYPLLDGLMKYWPFANYIKEMLFLSEVLEIIEVADLEKLDLYLLKFIKRFIKALGS